MQQSPEHERLAFLDSLRGLAALYVFVYHCVRVPDPDLPVPAFARPFLYNGGSGVTLFFVVSGFTMCLTMAQRPRTVRNAAQFYFRRFFRIAPLYYFWLAVMLARSWSWSDFSARKIALVSFVSFTFNFKPDWQLGEVWASWTLGVEMIFYLIFPLLMLPVRGRRSAVAWLAMTLLLSAAFQYWIWSRPAAGFDRDEFIHWSFLTHLPSFALGMLVFYCLPPGRTSAPPHRSQIVLTIGLVAVIAIPYLDTGWPYSLLHFLMASAYALVLAGLANVPVKLLVNPVTIFLGTISYSIYLNHVMTIHLLQPIFATVVAEGWPVAAMLPVCAAIAVVPLVLASTLTYFLIEKPGIAAGRWLNRKLDRTTTA